MTLPKTNAFVPLTAAVTADESREFRVMVTPQGAAQQPFKTLAQVVATTETAPPVEKKNCEPRLSVQRDGGRITHLQIQCSCGQVMELACLYEESSKT